MKDKKLIEIMSKNGIKGTFNLNSNTCKKRKSNYVPLEEIKEVYLNTGNEVAIHGVYHLSLPEIDSAMKVNEIISDRIFFEENLQNIVLKVQKRRKS